jgi:hypothetical protein
MSRVVGSTEGTWNNYLKILQQYLHISVRALATEYIDMNAEYISCLDCYPLGFKYLAENLYFCVEPI